MRATPQTVTTSATTASRSMTTNSPAAISARARNTLSPGLLGSAVRRSYASRSGSRMSTGRISEADINLAGKSGEHATLTVVVSDPGDVSLDAPAGATEVPIGPLLQTLMQVFGGSLPTP